MLMHNFYGMQIKCINIIRDVFFASACSKTKREYNRRRRRKSSQMKSRQLRRRVPPGNRFQCGQFIPRPWTGRSASCGLKYLLECQNFLLRDKHACLAVNTSRVIATAVMKYGFSSDGEVKAKTGNASIFGPIPECPPRDSFDDLRCLPRVIKTLTGLFINVGRRLHPGRLPELLLAVTPKIAISRQGNPIPAFPATPSRTSPGCGCSGGRYHAPPTWFAHLPMRNTAGEGHCMSL